MALTEFAMYNNILIPISLDHDTDVASTIAVARRLQAESGKITLVGVVEQVPGYVAEYVTVWPETKVQKHVEDQLRDLAKGQEDLDVAVLSGKPGVSIANMAEDTGADLIIIRSHRPGVEDYFLGSTASRVVRRAPCAVLVLR